LSGGEQASFRDGYGSALGVGALSNPVAGIYPRLIGRLTFPLLAVEDLGDSGGAIKHAVILHGVQRVSNGYA